MGESTCVMRAFAYPSSISNEAHEDNSMYALEESVSLGRFMTESLSWEKWSSFSRNRYVEEAEMYSRPGSVKQKKAYFEAHFKRMAALKAAALLEQANSAQGGGGGEPDPSKLESEVHNDGTEIHDHADLLVQDLVPSIMDQQWVENEDENSGAVDNCNVDESNDRVDQLGSEVIEETDQPDYNEDDLVEHFMDVEEQNPSFEMESDFGNAQESCVEMEVFHECVVEKEDDDLVADHNKDGPDDGVDEPSSFKIMAEPEQAPQVESTEHLMDVEKQKTSTELESGSVKKDEFHLECSGVNQDTTTATTSTISKSNLPSSSAFIPSTPMGATSPISKPKPSSSDFIPSTPMGAMLPISKPKPSSPISKPKPSSSVFIPSTPVGAMSPICKPKPSSSVYIPSAPMGKKNPKLSSYMSIDAETTALTSFSSPAKSVAQPAAVHPGKENSYTPIGRKSWIDDPDKKRTPLRMSINRELNRLISPVIKKIGGSSKASNKDCSTPLRTPAKVSVDDMKNDPVDTPQSGKRRARALFDSAGCGGSKASVSRWQFLSSEGSRSPAGGKKKTSSPIIPKSFCLSASRAPRRKERLEEKFNAKATENIQQQSKFKEKPKELAKLRQSFCFGAKLSSESFRERERLFEVPTEKSKETDCKIPKKGRSRLQNMTSLPPRKAVPKGTKNVK